MFVLGCVEEFETDSEDGSKKLENLLVVDAKLTDENKRHFVFLSRTFQFLNDDVPPETNAQVSIIDNDDNEYIFSETEAGVYRSDVAFSALPDKDYHLIIRTSDGKTYESNPEKIPVQIPIQELTAVRTSDDFGNEQVSILVNTDITSGSSGFFRYEYEETFKIIAPFYNPFEWGEIDYTFFTDGDLYDVDIKPREEEARVCFGTRNSKNIVLGETETMTTNSLSRFPVKNISRDDYAISHRYSILVKQFSLSVDSYGYYLNLENFSSSESVFSNIQPGFLEGNIYDSSDSENRVLGYFEVASVSEERLFFNFEDFFPDEPLPPYVINCEPTGAPPLHSPGFEWDHTTGVITGDAESPLIEAILAGVVAYHATNENFLTELHENGIAGTAPYFTKSTACVDCRVLGSNVKPDFWIEE